MRPMTLALKDIRLLIRDKSALFWVLGFPIVIAVLFGFVFGGSNGPSRIEVALIDQDGTKESQQLVAALTKSEALKIAAPENGKTELADSREKVRKGGLAAYLLIPKGFGEEVRTFQYANGPGIKIGIDPTRKAEAGMLQGVVSQAAYTLMSGTMSSSQTNLKENLDRIDASNMDPARKAALSSLLKDVTRFRTTDAGSGSSFKFEGPKVETDSVAGDGKAPKSSFELTFPQALIWGLLGVISSFAISLVKEREQGTLVRLQSAMSMGEILAGKALACFLTAAGVMAALLLLGHFAFGVRLSSPLLLALAIGSGSLCIVGIMMLLSVLGRTEQAVAGSSWGVMIIMAMFGGGMIPVFVMPAWMLAASNFSPLKWTTLTIEGAIWRGFTFQDMLAPCAILIAIGAVCFGVGVRVFSNRL